ncbi:fungal specific transcription factor domain-containing protein [Aspergillus lucknowensis]|uniref:Xylanolytic transcriptional activator regulatory domain-containing protein n=1 Tax=Aspergillus lucknowensis TaxID=176173 RepID=A0ABR4M368_9EURO
MQNLPATKPHVGVSELVPSRPIADRLVAAYFRTFESVYRIIHRPSFQRLYDRFWECRPADQTFAIQLILILSIGSVFEPGHTSRKSITEWIYVAQQWLDSPSDQPRLHLEAIQVHCLLLIARQATAVDGENLWISTGHLLTSAMHLGLHIDPRHLIQPSPFHAEHRRRLWATVLELIIQSSMDSGGVPLIGDYDCAPPRNLNDDQIENDILPADAKEFTDTSVQIALLRSLPLRLRIARTVNNFRSGLSYEETLRFSTELLDIYREAAIVLQPADSSRQSTPFQRKLYDLMTQRFLLVLHDRFFMQAKSNPSYSYSRKLALKASFHILNLSSPTDSCDYTSLSLSGAAGFRDIPMQAAGELSDELLSRVSTDSSTRSASGLVKNNDDLRGPLDAFLSTTLTRLQISETNVKTYVIFRCFLAQVDAIQAGQGVDVNDVIRETLRDGLATAAGILEAVAGSSSQAADTLSNNTNHNELANDPDDWILNDNVTGDIDSWLLGYG